MKSTDEIEANDETQVHAENSYSIFHNFPESEKRPDAPPDNTDRSNLGQVFLRQLCTSVYEERKIRNPTRADGTCEWLINHELFKVWQKKRSAALLWVTAEPGCGKSVLARYLADDVLASDYARSTCYFFFKYDFGDQRTLESGICCILHQVFTQRPDLLSGEILDRVEDEGEGLFSSFTLLWELLVQATTVKRHGEIVCILDGLDECADHYRLVTALAKLYEREDSGSMLKFVVTSRRNSEMQQCFQLRKHSQSIIHLEGEKQEETEKMEREIRIVIEQRTIELCQELSLGDETKTILLEGLSTFRHRTHLWARLIFDANLDVGFFRSRGNDLRARICKLPRTAEEIYENILCQSRDPEMTRKILHIVVVADRPLNLKEMAVALALKTGHEYHEDLMQDIATSAALYTTIKETCGLLLSAQGSEVVLVHQTAREFLVSVLLDRGSCPWQWQHSLETRDSQHVLAEICMRYLLLNDFRKPNQVVDDHISGNLYRKKPIQAGILGKQHFLFLRYAASNWTKHYRLARSDTNLQRLALQLCDAESIVCKYWVRVYGKHQLGDRRFDLTLNKSIFIASYFGLDDVFEILLQESSKDIDSIGGWDQRTPLSWASERGHSSIVNLILERVPRRQTILKSSSPFSSIVNQIDVHEKTPLCHAAASGHLSIVESLLGKGAKVNTRDDNGLMPLFWASKHGYDDIVAFLLEHGAQKDLATSNPRTQYRMSRTPLVTAAMDGDEVTVRHLLKHGANAEAACRRGMTPLMEASKRGHLVVVKLLLDHGADTNHPDSSYNTPLMKAAKGGHDKVVNLLLENGAHVNDSNEFGRTVLLEALKEGHSSVANLLLGSGANISHTDHFGDTALIEASKRGHETLVRYLLDSGADVHHSSYVESTALMEAAKEGQEEVVRLLLDRGAEVNHADGFGTTALMEASNDGHEAVVKLLLRHGASLPKEN